MQVELRELEGVAIGDKLGFQSMHDILVKIGVLLVFSASLTVFASAAPTDMCSNTIIQNCYHFNETSGDLIDHAGNNDGTLNGDITRGEPRVNKN